MSLEIDESQSKLNDITGQIVVFSTLSDGGAALTELRGPDCKRKALSYAASRGLSSPGLNGSVETFPVGEDLRELDDLQAIKAGAKIKRFQAVVPVTRRIV